MAKNYSNVDLYAEEMGGKYPDLFRTWQENEAVNGDSAVRNYIASQMQRLSDNGFEVNNTFLSAVGGMQSGAFTGFNEQFGLGDDTGALGKNELLALAYTMAELDAMQADGRIDAGTYGRMMNSVTSEDFLKGLRNHGNNGVFDSHGDNMFKVLDNISALGDSEPDPAWAEANAKRLSVEARPYINEVGDYYDSARNDERRTRERDPNYDPYTLLCQNLAQAHADGLIDDATYEASQTTLLRNIGQGTENDARTRANTLLYAMEDALVLGDKDLAGKIFSREGIENIGTPFDMWTDDPNHDGKALGVLQQLDKANYVYRSQHPELTAPLEPDPVITPDPIDPPAFNGYFYPAMDEEKMSQVAGAMKQNYFEAEGHMSQEAYDAAMEQYNQCVEDYGQESADAWLKNNAPEGFREAKAFMDNVDALEQGVNDGTYRIRSELDEDGKTVYSVERTDGKYDTTKFPNFDPRNLGGGQPVNYDYANYEVWREQFPLQNGTTLELDPELGEFLSLNSPGFTSAMGTAINDVEEGRYVDHGGRDDHDHSHIEFVDTGADLGNGQIDMEGLGTIGDAMVLDYFDSLEPGPDGKTFTLDDYAAVAAEHERVMNEDGYQGDDQFMRDHPEYAAAQAFMTQIDSMTEGVAKGQFRITVGVDEDGNTTYGIERTDDGEHVAGYDAIMEKFGPAYEEYAGITEPTQDYDYGAGLIDLSVLAQPSPQEQFEAMRDLAGECWAGTYGNGEDRVKAIMALGYSYEDYQTIQSMVNMGREWDGTVESWEKEYPSADGTTLAERESEFQAARSEAAVQMMTYEGSEDFLAAYNASAGPDGQITAEQAEELYGKAAQAMSGAYGEDGGLPEGVGDTLEEGGLAEAVSNLAEYADEHPEAGIAVPEAPAAEPDPHDPGYDPNGFTPEVM